MPFKVKATLVNFLGDTKKYPCHFLHKIGDEIIWDGEKLIGRVCPDVLPLLIPVMHALRYAGPRYKDPMYYAPFWYASLSIFDPSMKKYDGLGFKVVKEKIVEPPYHVASLQPPNAFQWPPVNERIVMKDITVLCPDTRTSAVFKVEPFDLSDTGHDVPYFRREMVILYKVMQKPGIEVNKILDEFTKEEREEIYPPLSPVLVQALVEELELVGYIKVKEGKAYTTDKGKIKLDEFKASLTTEEKKALKLK
ncbi:TIGR04076 family protein [Candidatus Bathyarchaeota archaeon]|nr:TIGR04076 family protein [Candidatus Bathyarchaeota archaeon]